jgi:hypothetical protein
VINDKFAGYFTQVGESRRNSTTFDTNFDHKRLLTTPAHKASFGTEDGREGSISGHVAALRTATRRGVYLV